MKYRFSGYSSLYLAYNNPVPHTSLPFRRFCDVIMPVSRKSLPVPSAYPA